MDDGHCASNGRYGIYLNTQGFTYTSVEALCFILKNQLYLDCWVASKKSKSNLPYIVISGHSYNTFFNLVKPYIHPSMRYKFPQGSRTQ